LRFLPAISSLQRIVGLRAGVKYMVQAIIEASLGNTISLWSHVLCRDPTASDAFYCN
jgi:hypothetical protein